MFFVILCAESRGLILLLSSESRMLILSLSAESWMLILPLSAEFRTLLLLPEFIMLPLPLSAEPWMLILPLHAELLECLSFPSLQNPKCVMLFLPLFAEFLECFSFHFPCLQSQEWLPLSAKSRNVYPPSVCRVKNIYPCAVSAETRNVYPSPCVDADWPPHANPEDPRDPLYYLHLKTVINSTLCL